MIEHSCRVAAVICEQIHRVKIKAFLKIEQ